MSLEGRDRAKKPMFAIRDRVYVNSGRWSGRSGTVFSKGKVKGMFEYQVRLDGMSDLTNFGEKELTYIRSGGS